MAKSLRQAYDYWQDQPQCEMAESLRQAHDYWQGEGDPSTHFSSKPAFAHLLEAFPHGMLSFWGSKMLSFPSARSFEGLGIFLKAQKTPYRGGKL